MSNYLTSKIPLTLWRLALLIAALSLVGCEKLGEGKKPVDKVQKNEPVRLPQHYTPILPGWFENIATKAGVTFRLGHGGRSPLRILETMGTGCAALDFDNDNLPDLFFVGQTGTDSEGKSMLYKGKGDGTFVDVSKESGLQTPGMYMGCTVGDFNNDSLPDILVTGYGVVRLYKNLGQLRFQEVTKGSGLEAPSKISWATSAAFFDYDKDGLADLYIGRYVKFDETSLQFCDYGEVKASCGPNFYDAQHGSLYKNLGNGKFKDVTVAMGIDAAHGKCLGVTVADVNNDGWLDLYLGNDEMPGDLLINEKGKKFHEDGLARGVALAGDGQFQGAMGVDFADHNRDLLPDLIVTTYEFEPNSLYNNTSEGIYKPMSQAMGLDHRSRMMVGFGTKFADFNNDGWLDLAITNGHIHDNQEKLDKNSHYRQSMQLFMRENNRIETETKGQITSAAVATNVYADRTPEAGAAFTEPAVGRGLATSDLNNDGLVDVVVVDLEGQARVLLNRMPNPGNWLRVRLQATRSNRMALGAKVFVYSEDQKWMAECTTSGSYLSSSDPRLHFGLGTIKKVDRIEVKWLSGRTSTISNPPMGKETVIIEP